MQDKLRAVLGNLVQYSERKGADMSMVPQEIREAATYRGPEAEGEWVPDERYSPEGQVTYAVNPETLQIDVQAPEYYVNSPEFQNEVLPMFQQLEGQSIADIEKSPLFSPEVQQQIQQQADVIRVRQGIVDEYLQENPNASQEDALIYFQNSTAGLRNDDDDDTQVVLPNVGGQGFGSVRAPGTTGSNVSVKEFMDSMRDRPDMFRLNFYNRMNAIARDSNEHPTNRAAAQGVINFMQAKGLLRASEDTQSRVATQEWINTLRGTLPGAIGGALAELSIGSDAYREQVEATDQLRQLEGAEAQAQAQAIPRMAVGLGLDLAATGGLVGAARAGIGAAGRAASSLPGIAGATAQTVGSQIARAGVGLEALRRSGVAGQIATGVVRDTPFNLAYGTQQALTNVINQENQDDVIGGFVDDTLISAGLFGLAGTASRALRAVDTASNARLSEISSSIGRGIQRAEFAIGDAIRKIPSEFTLGNTIVRVPSVKNFTKNTVNANAPFTRHVEKARAGKDISDEDYYNAYNAVNVFNNRGAGLVQDVIRNSPSYGAVVSVNQLMTPDELRVASDFNNAYQKLVHAERGGYENATEESIQRLRDEVAELETEMDQLAAKARSEGRSYDSRGYRQQLIQFNEDVNSFSRQQGLTNADIERLLFENNALTGDYTTLRNEVEAARNYFSGRTNRLTTRDTRQRLSGLTDAPSVDPLRASLERLNAVAEQAATQQIHRIIANGIEQGWIEGRILQTPEQGLRRERLQIEARNRRERVIPRIRTMVNQLSDELPDMVDEIVNAGGTADYAMGKFADAIRVRIDEAANDLVEDNVIGRQIREYTEGTDIPPLQVAYEMIDTNRSQIPEMVRDAFGGTRLDHAQQRDLADSIAETINSQTSKAIAESGSVAGVNDIFQELKDINKAIRDERSDANFVQEFWSGGGKGAYEVVDPDLIEFMSKANTPVEAGMLRRFLEGAARVFRFGTTAGNLAFNYAVSPVRDSLQSAVLSGTGVFNPTYTRRTLLETIYNGDQAKVDAAMRQLDVILEGSSFQDMQRGQEYAARTARQRRAQDANYQRELERSLRGWGERRGSLKEVTLNTADIVRRPLQSLRNPTRIMRQVEDIMSVPEMRMRERVYITRLQAAKDRGVSDAAAEAEAAFYATQAMTMFSNVGEKVQTLVRTIPYLNAGIQGIASFRRLWLLDPVGVSSRLAAGVITPVAYLTAMNMTDPDKVETYYEVPRYERETNFIVVLDGGAVLKIPMGYELAALVNPVRETIEAMHGLGDQDFMGSLLRGISIASPIDVSGFIDDHEPGQQGSVQRGVERLVSGLLPQGVAPGVEAFLGRNLYTGNPLAPTEQELIARGDLDPSQVATAGDLTYAANDSRLLRGIADATGIPQGNLQSFVQSVGGELGQMLVGAIDRISGAPEKQQGGRGFVESFSRRFFNKDPNQTDRDFYAGLERLEERRDQLRTRLEKLGRNSYQDRDDPQAQTINEQERQNLINQYADEVAAFADEYGQYYARVGGLNAARKRQLVGLLNIATDNQQVFEAGSPQAQDAQRQFFDARDQGRELAVRSGLASFDERDLFGRTRRAADGEGVETDMRDTTFLNQMIRNSVFGTPRRAIADFNTAMRANRKEGIPSMSSIKREFQERISAIYDRGNLGPADYDEIEALQREYMEQFDARFQPIIEKYGTAILNNNEVINELRGMVMIPRDEWAAGTRTSRSGKQYQQFISSKVFPNAGPDVRKILQERYGANDAAAQGLETDEEVRERIDQINARLDRGQRGAAMSMARTLQDQIDRGNYYIDEFDLANLRNILGGN